MKKDNGFGLVYIFAIIVVVAAVVVAGALVYNRNHKKTNNPTASNQTGANTAPQVQAQQYLDIKEWKIKLPLSSDISDAYYVVSTSSHDSNGQPNTMWLGVKSLDNVGNCNASKANSGQAPLASLGRTLPSDKDPVSGQTYQQKYPDGTTLNGYYYGYNGNWIKNEPCTKDDGYQTQLQNINTAFASAAKNIVAE